MTECADKRNELEQQIVGLEQTTAKAEAETKDLNERYTSNLQELNDVRKSKLQQSKQLAVLEGQLTRTRQELNEEKTKLTETSQQCDAEVQRSQTLESARETLAREYRDSTTQLNRVKDELAKLKDALQHTRAQKDQMELDATERNNKRIAMAQLRSEHATFNDTNTATKTALQNLRNEMTTRVAEVRSLMGDKTDLVKERNRLSADLETTKEQNQGQKDQIVYFEEELENEKADAITRIEYETAKMNKQFREDKAGLTKRLEQENARITRHLEEEQDMRARERQQWVRAENTYVQAIESRDEEIEALN